MPAVALTDTCNLFAMVKFYRTAMGQGVKPIIGAEVWLNSPEFDSGYSKLLLLCQNRIGYRQLTELVTMAYKQGERLTVPLIDKQWLRLHSEGLIAISLAEHSDIGQWILKGNHNQAQELIQDYQQIFPNSFYLGLIRTNKPNQADYEKGAVKLAQAHKLPVVALNEVAFMQAEDFEAHEARVCIQEGTTLNQERQKRYTQEQHFKTPAQMKVLFADIPSSIENTVQIAKRCNLKLNLDQSVLPSFPVPSGMNEETYLEQLAQKGLNKRLKALFELEPDKERDTVFIDEYRQRLKIELEVINSMGFPGYFLIVADFIQWAKNNGIPVGPGRGSGAGSLVAYSLEITDLDPLKFELLFERFLNPERVSMPDFDIDFCMDGRDSVIEYVAERYGKTAVSQIATFGTMAAKAVVRDVGRVLGFSYGFVDKIAKLIPFEIGMTLSKALEDEPALKERYNKEDEVKGLIDLAKKLEGMARNVGKHAGGVVIAPSVLTDFTPLYCESPNAALVTQFDKDDVEHIGLVKFDFLGLRTLTIIDWAIKNANEINKKQDLPLVDINKIPYDDKKTFALLKQCATTAVFQLESRGMKELIKRLQPDQFEEIIALVALFRPGPLQSGMVDDFINRKHGRAKVEYPHPDITDILKPTYGVILYQEQVMQIAQVLAGYSLGAADLLRRAMGKKKPEEMAKQREIFTKGAVERGVEEATATYIFDLMEKFAGYGFNKSHSAAYAMVAYQTAWLKAHYPAPFMAAVLSSDMNSTDKVVTFFAECKSMRIPVLKPSVNKSAYLFRVERDSIRYGLGAIKGVGEAAIEEIVAQRIVEPYKDLFDFCQRLDKGKINKRVIEALIKSGAMDDFHDSRAAIYAQMDDAFKHAEQVGKNLSFGQGDLFSDESHYVSKIKDDIAAWPKEQILQFEKETLGLYWSGHPINIVRHELDDMGVRPFHEVRIRNQEIKVLFAGIVASIRTMQTRNGDRMAILGLDDGKDFFEVAIFPDTYQQYREVIQKDNILICQCVASIDKQGRKKIRAENVFDLAKARGRYAKALDIVVEHSTLNNDTIKVLKGILSTQEKGECVIRLSVKMNDVITRLRLNADWRVNYSPDLINEITDNVAADVSVDYSR